MANLSPRLNIRKFYEQFDAPITRLDCGALCAPHNPSGKPFCCDICEAVPVAYHSEWEYLQKNSDLWHAWRGDECAEPCDPAILQSELPAHLILLACKGPQDCRREFRASSCRQFPFFPYITANDRFLGLAYDWDFEPMCWVINHLEEVSDAYRRQFIQTYDQLFLIWEEEFESYAVLSEQMRESFAAKKRRIPLLHRNGSDYLLSPQSERLQRVEPAHFRRFGPYKTS